MCRTVARAGVRGMSGSHPGSVLFTVTEEVDATKRENISTQTSESSIANTVLPLWTGQLQSSTVSNSSWRCFGPFWDTDKCVTVCGQWRTTSVTWHGLLSLRLLQLTRPATLFCFHVARSYALVVGEALLIHFSRSLHGCCCTTTTTTTTRAQHCAAFALHIAQTTRAHSTTPGARYPPGAPSRNHRKRSATYLGSRWRLRASTRGGGRQQCDARTEDHSCEAQKFLNESVREIAHWHTDTHTPSQCLTDLCATHRCGVCVTDWQRPKTELIRLIRRRVIRACVAARLCATERSLLISRPTWCPN